MTQWSSSFPIKDIPGDARILLRIPPDWVTEKTPTPRPNSGNFQIKSGDTGLSVDIWEDDASPKQTLAGHDNFKLVSLTVGDIRKFNGLEVVHDPVEGNPRHAEIRGVPYVFPPKK